jgi:DNA-binding XRE family transcriptional regulator
MTGRDIAFDRKQSGATQAELATELDIPVEVVIAIEKERGLFKDWEPNIDQRVMIHDAIDKIKSSRSTEQIPAA